MGEGSESPPGGRALREVRAAQLRARANRRAIGNLTLATVFLLGGLAHGLGPRPDSPSTMLWMVLLALLSTVHVGIGLRTLSRLRWRAARVWLPVTLAWGALALILLRILTYR